MKILVVSDTHERTAELSHLLKKHSEEVQLVCHLGDHAQDLLRFQTQYPELDMVAVAGNCDYSPYLQDELTLTLEGKKILLIHGHYHGVKSGSQRLLYYAMEKEVDAVFYGHAHRPDYFRHGGVLVLSPGSPCWPRGTGVEASYAIVEISESGEIKGEIIKYEKD